VAGGHIVADSQPGYWDVLDSHTYAEDGSYTISFQVTDTGGASASKQRTITAFDAPLTSASVNTSTATVNAVTTITASFTDQNAGAPGTDFTAKVQWGDNTYTLLGSGSFSSSGGGHFSLQATHSYAVGGTYTVSVQVLDADSSSVSASATLGVADLPLTAAHVGSFAATEGASTGLVRVATFTDTNSLGNVYNFTATVTWGDGSTTTVTGLNGGIRSLGGGQYQVLASHTYAEEGTYSLSVQVLDTGGASISTGATLAVADAPLSSLTLTDPNAHAGQDTGTFTVATFHDGNAAAPTTDFTAVVQWGDGSTTTLTSAAFQPQGGGNFAVLTHHLYASAGTYTLSVQVGDVGAASISKQLRIAVH
jgi:hypothetical protein